MRYLFEKAENLTKRRPENMASSISSKILEIRKESIKRSMGDLQTMSHRQQFVETIEGVTYYDDSQAENINATWFTFENIFNPVVWIVGGSCHNNYSELIETAKKKVRVIISLGKEQENIEMTFKGTVHEIYAASSIQEAVSMASIVAQENEIVLFSPACKDNDMGFADRGDTFVREVHQLNEIK
ncbi:MAG: hypothetical protein IKT08_09535 [Bacteroidales bacterium]|nr:hypothetical protein [Bacteroidales bacterium]